MPRPMRSWMFVPGNVPRFLEKASVSEADAVFLDLEDGVLPDAKAEARRLVAEVLAHEWMDGPQRYVRVNAQGTKWFEQDIETVLRPGLDGICIPKVESAADLKEVAGEIESYEEGRGLAGNSIRLVAAIETATAVTRAPEIANGHPRLFGVMFGAEDFALDLGLGTQRRQEASEFLFARSAIAIAAASARIMSIDGVYPSLDDPEGLVADGMRARRIGFTAKSTFNPRQLEAINRIFSPQPDELEYARKLVESFKLAQERGEASVVVGGQLVDLPIVRRAQRILEVDQELHRGS